MRAIFQFWDVTYLEELTLNFDLPDYNKYGQKPLSELTKEDDFSHEAVKNALEKQQ